MLFWYGWNDTIELQTSLIVPSRYMHELWSDKFYSVSVRLWHRYPWYLSHLHCVFSYSRTDSVLICMQGIMQSSHKPAWLCLVYVWMMGLQFIFEKCTSFATISMILVSFSWCILLQPNRFGTDLYARNQPIEPQISLIVPCIHHLQWVSSYRARLK